MTAFYVSADVNVINGTGLNYDANVNANIGIDAQW